MKPICKRLHKNRFRIASSPAWSPSAKDFPDHFSVITTPAALRIRFRSRSRGSSWGPVPGRRSRRCVAHWWGSQLFRRTLSGERWWAWAGQQWTLHIANHPRSEIRIANHQRSEIRIANHPRSEIRISNHPRSEIRIANHPRYEIRITNHPRSEKRIVNHPTWSKIWNMYRQSSKIRNTYHQSSKI